MVLVAVYLSTLVGSLPPLSIDVELLVAAWSTRLVAILQAHSLPCFTLEWLLVALVCWDL